MSTTTIPDDADCQRCGEKAQCRTCDRCGVSAMITDCGCKAQPRPIAADGCRVYCDACSDARAVDGDQCLTATLMTPARPMDHSEALTGGTVEEIAAQLPEDYDGPRLTVYDAAGFVRGWIGGRADWRAA